MTDAQEGYYQPGPVALLYGRFTGRAQTASTGWDAARRAPS